jgi:formylmethanofuran dehydrogenase subunit E
MRSRYTKVVFAALVGLGTAGVVAHQAPRTHDDHAAGTTRSSPGDSPWNRGKPPKDWWAEIERSHGHVGPWNVLGWRIGQAALREFEADWGCHTLDIVCCIPLETPYSCMADGLTIGTGNSIGRLDIRLAEVMSVELVQVCIRRKDGQGPVLVFEPRMEYMKRIRQRPVEELEGLSRECRKMRDGELFRIRRIESN